MAVFESRWTLFKKEFEDFISLIKDTMSNCNLIFIFVLFKI